MTTPQTGTTSTQRRRSGGLWLAALAMTGIALLIWSKLRLVTGIPRTAYAVPREVQPTPSPGAGADGRVTASVDEPSAEDPADPGAR